MRFFLIIIVVVASGAGLHFLDVINKFQGSTAEKVRAIKPESIRNKIKEPKTSQPVYTFFETLDDHTMTKYVDLKQGLLSTALLPEKIKVVPAKIKVNPASISAVEKTAKLEPVKKPQSKRNSKNSTSVKETPRYAVQVSSFRDETRASALKMQLQKNGFDAFLMKKELANDGGTWYRVFLGRYVEELKAQGAASLVKNKYKLNAVVVRNTN